MMINFKSRQAKDSGTTNTSAFTKNKSANTNATAGMSFSNLHRAKDKSTKNF